MLSKFSTIANLSYSDVLNSTLLTDNTKDNFGKKEPITDVLTRSKSNNNLTLVGEKLVYVINMISPDHIK